MEGCLQDKFQSHRNLFGVDDAAVVVTPAKRIKIFDQFLPESEVNVCCVMYVKGINEIPETLFAGIWIHPSDLKLKLPQLHNLGGRWNKLSSKMLQFSVFEGPN